jgi:hypothetical protein
MIKSTVGERETQNEKQFPKLMIDKSDSFIVLFYDKEVGTVVSCDNGIYGIGYYSNNWSMSCFDDCNEPITLQNE